MTFVSRSTGVAAAFVVAGALACSAPATDPPNVVLYLVDTLRADSLGAYGHPRVETPAFDRLATEGTLFPNAFANSTWTRASVASLFTGHHAQQHGARTRLSVLEDESDTLAEILAARGYATALVTTNPNAGATFGFGQGFQEVVELFEQPGFLVSNQNLGTSDEVTERAIAWLDSAPRPFLLVAHTTDPHGPYTPPKAFDRYMPEYRGRVDGTDRHFQRKNLSTADRQRIRSLYEGEISFNDASFARLLAALEERDLVHDTLVVMTSDHGEEFWEYDRRRRGHGNALTDLQMRVPLLVRFPRSDRVGRGVRDPRPVQGVDLLPTILDLLDLPLPEAIAGRPLFTGARDAAPVFSSVELDGHRLYAVVEPPWKLVWDAARDEERLYRLGAPEPDGVRDRAEVAGEELVRRHLRARLDAHLAAGELEPSTSPGTVEDLPENVRRALRALGYLGE